jgi:hypothetical protein
MISKSIAFVSMLVPQKNLAKVTLRTMTLVVLIMGLGKAEFS